MNVENVCKISRETYEFHKKSSVNWKEFKEGELCLMFRDNVKLAGSTESICTVEPYRWTGTILYNWAKLKIGSMFLKRFV